MTKNNPFSRAVTLLFCALSQTLLFRWLRWEYRDTVSKITYFVNALIAALKRSVKLICMWMNVKRSARAVLLRIQAEKKTSGNNKDSDSNCAAKFSSKTKFWWMIEHVKQIFYSFFFIFFKIFYIVLQILYFYVTIFWNAEYNFTVSDRWAFISE